MSPLPAAERRRLKRTALKERASVVVKRRRQEERMPCLILDSSQEGFRIRGVAQLKRGLMVELILEEHPMNPVVCTVMWVGKPGAKNAGEVGLQIVRQKA